MHEKMNWVKIENVDNDIEAEIIKDILQNEGIECKILFRENVQYMKLITGNLLGTQGIDILVEEDEATNAINIIKAYQEQIQSDDL